MTKQQKQAREWAIEAHVRTFGLTRLDYVDVGVGPFALPKRVMRSSEQGSTSVVRASALTERLVSTIDARSRCGRVWGR